MNRNALSVCLAIALTFILSSLPVNAQQPRAVPDNDNLINAKTIKIGKTYTVLDIGAATNEPLEPVSACGSPHIANSVWYTFSVPTHAFIYLTTAGSHFYHSAFPASTDADLSVYELSGTTFTELTCGSIVPYTDIDEITLLAVPGKLYYVAAGTALTFDYESPSRLKLTTRLLATSILPPNHSFETPVTGADWQLKQGSDDQITCSDPAYPADIDDCAFKFTATGGITTKLIQSMPIPSNFALRRNGQLIARFSIRVVDTPAITNTKVSVIVRYTDGTPPTKETLNLEGFGAEADYTFRKLVVDLQSGRVADIKFQVKFGAASGGLLLDTIAYTYQAAPSTRGDGLLPVPQAAK